MKLLPFVLLAVLAGPALAAGDIELTVGGVIRPASCTMTVGGGGRFDVGEIDPSRLKGGSILNYMAVMEAPFLLTCTSPTRWALKGMDHRHGTGHVNGVNTFGLGQDRSGNNIGVYILVVVDAVADGVAVSSTGSLDGGTAWSTSVGDNGQLSSDPNKLVGFTEPGAEPLGPKVMKSFVATMKLWPILTNAASLDTSEDIELDGASTIQLYML